MTVAIDTAATSAAARIWTSWGDAIQRVQLIVDRDVRVVQLEGARAPWHLGAAATELWAAAVLAQLLVERVLVSDRLDAPEVARLAELAGARVVSAGGGPWSAGFSPPGGELGGTYRAELRSPWLLQGASAEQRGRALVAQALLDTASPVQIRRDEFELVALSDGRFVVVLPGVTDLRLPDAGWSDEHRTVRDTDRVAYESSRSTGLDGNRYARMVAAGLWANGVPPGSELVIVGHSFGADTALDLAGDPSFNGADGFRVTHVVAAGYHSGPQLGHVPAGTAVLVLQNRYDAVVFGERLTAGHVTESFEARRDVAEAIVGLDPRGVVDSGVRAVGHDLAAAASAVGRLIGRSRDVVELAIEGAGRDLVGTGRELADVLLPDAGVTQVAPEVTVAVFDGGIAGAGHDQQEYLRYLHRADDPAVLAFLATVGASATTVGGSRVIDVSVPDQRRSPVARRTEEKT